MAEETTPKDLATTAGLPDTTLASPAEPGAATAEAMKRAPQAVRRSMPMALSITIGILLAGLIGWFFHYLVWFILVLYLCFVAATIFEAPVQWLKRRGIRRGMSAVIVMVSSLAILIVLLYFLATGVYSQVSAVSENLSKAPDRINHFVNSVRHNVVKAPAKSVTTNDKALRTAITPPGTALPTDVSTPSPTAGTAPAVAPAPPATPTTAHPETQPGDFDVVAAITANLPPLSAVWTNAMLGVETVSWLVIMFFITLYMLVDGSDHLKNLRRLIPKHNRLEATRFFNEIAEAHRGWALASLSNVLSASILTSTGLYLLGVPGAFLLGFLAGCGELIPNIGPFLGAMPAILLTLLAEPDKFFLVVGMFVIVQTIQSYTISPMMLKFSVELPVLVTIISVLVFGMLFGFLGILVAIPLVADMVVLWQYANRYLEKDTEDYDEVNTRAMGKRTPMAPDNNSPSRLRKLFRRNQQRPNPGDPFPSSSSSNPANAAMTTNGTTEGLDRLDEAERRTIAKSAAGKANDAGGDGGAA